MRCDEGPTQPPIHPPTPPRQPKILTLGRGWPSRPTSVHQALSRGDPSRTPRREPEKAPDRCNSSSGSRSNRSSDRSSRCSSSSSGRRKEVTEAADAKNVRSSQNRVKKREIEQLCSCWGIQTQQQHQRDEAPAGKTETEQVAVDAPKRRHSIEQLAANVSKGSSSSTSVEQLLAVYQRLSWSDAALFSTEHLHVFRSSLVQVVPHL